VRNKYPGKCYRCGETVEAGAGHFEKIEGGTGWRVQHATCCLLAREEKEKTRSEERDRLNRELSDG